MIDTHVLARVCGHVLAGILYVLCTVFPLNCTVNGRLGPQGVVKGGTDD